MANRWATHVYVYTQHMQYPGALEQMVLDAAAGQFEGVEVFLHDLDDDDQRHMLIQLLHEHGIDLIGASVNVELWDDEKVADILPVIDRQTDMLAELGGTILGLSTLPQPPREKTDGDFDRQAENILKIGERIKAKGIDIAYHTYAPDGFDDCEEIEQLTRRLSPSELRLGPDLCWLYRGGADPAAFIRRFGDRIDFLHVRDEKDEVWTERIGEGAIDWRDVGQALREINYTGWICVELADTDNVTYPASLRERHVDSRNYLQKLWGM